MKTKLICLFLIFASIGGILHAQGSGDVIPFQGQLANQAGQPLNPTNAVTLVFRLYQVPVGGAAIWEEAQPNISVNGGRFSVLLGSRTQLPAQSYFNATLYLGITVDDGNPATADVEMRPRQALVPVLSANYAKNADKLDGYDWSSILAGGTNDPTAATIAESKLPAGIAVPVGAVIMWWGNVASIPQNFELCDGAAPTTPGSTLGGNKPDLRDKFVKGATNGATTKAELIAGGSHTIAQRDSLGFTITKNELPAYDLQYNLRAVPISGTTNSDHSHTITGPSTQDDAGGSDGTFALGDSQDPKPFPTLTVTGGRHQHAIQGTISSGGGNGSHSHTIPAHDNRPAFQELFYIIRVK